MALYIEIPQNPHQNTIFLQEELLLIIPESEKLEETKIPSELDCILKIQEDIGPQFLIFTTQDFQYVFKIIDYRSISSLGITSSIKKENHQLVLSNFTTNLGLNVADFFMSIFPINVESNQIVNFTVQKDFIYFRMYRCCITEKKTLFNKLGPHLTLRLWRMTDIVNGEKIITNFKKYIKNANLL